MEQITTKLQLVRVVYIQFLHYHTHKYTYHKIQNAQILCCCTYQSVHDEGTLQ